MCAVNRGRSRIHTYMHNCFVRVLRCSFDKLVRANKFLHVLFHVRACQLHLHGTGHVGIFGLPTSNTVECTQQ